MRLARYALVLPLVALAALPSCGKDSGAPPASAVLAPLPAPAGLVAEIFVPKPSAAWTKVRELGGGPAKLLPASYAMLVATVLGLPATAAELVDNDVPTVGAITSDGKSELAVLAIHVRDGTRMITALTTGAEARFAAQEDAASHVTLLTPKPGQTSLAASLGVTANYLLVGYAPDALLQLGPYAARTVPAHPMPSEDVVVLSTHDALAGPLKTRLATWWSDAKRALDASDAEQRDKHGGSAPTFGDPRAAIGRADASFQALFALMSDLSEARTAISIDDAGAHVKTTLKPHGANGPARAELAAMVVGDAEPLLDLPAAVTVAMLTRDSADVRERTAKEQQASIEQLFSGKLDDASKAKVSDLLSAWAKGRGDWLAGGALVEGGRPTLYARSAVADEASLEKGIRGLLDVPKVPAFGEWLGHFLGEAKASSTQPAGDGVSGSIVKIERKAPELPRALAKERKREVDRFEVGWAFDHGTMETVAGDSGRAALKTLAAARGAGLRGDADVKRALDALGKDAAFTLVVLPIRLVASLSMKKLPPGGALPTAPVVLAMGKTGDAGWFRIDAAPAAVRELAKLRSSLE